MTREVARREIESLDYYLQNHTDDYSEESHTAMMMAISALSAEGEYIKKEDATKALSDHFIYLQRLKHDEGNGCKKYEQAGINWCLNTLNELPTYSFPDREKGEWIVREDNTSFVKQIPRRWVECSHCGWSFSYDRIHDDFCSKCGADMRKTETCNGCTHPCIMYEPTMKACEKKGR